MRIKNALKIAIAAVILPFMAGCATFHQNQALTHHAEQKISAARLPASKPVVQTVNTPFLLGNAVKIQQVLPGVFSKDIHLASISPSTLSGIAADISTATGMVVHVESGNIQRGFLSGGPTLPPLPGETGGGISLSG